MQLFNLSDSTAGRMTLLTLASLVLVSTAQFGTSVEATPMLPSSNSPSVGTATVPPGQALADQEMPDMHSLAGTSDATPMDLTPTANGTSPIAPSTPLAKVKEPVSKDYQAKKEAGVSSTGEAPSTPSPDPKQSVTAEEEPIPIEDLALTEVIKNSSDMSFLETTARTNLHLRQWALERMGQLSRERKECKECISKVVKELKDDTTVANEIIDNPIVGYFGRKDKFVESCQAACQPSAELDRLQHYYDRAVPKKAASQTDLQQTGGNGNPQTSGGDANAGGNAVHDNQQGNDDNGVVSAQADKDVDVAKVAVELAVRGMYPLIRLALSAHQAYLRSWLDTLHPLIFLVENLDNEDLKNDLIHFFQQMKNDGVKIGSWWTDNDYVYNRFFFNEHPELAHPEALCRSLHICTTQIINLIFAQKFPLLQAPVGNSNDAANMGSPSTSGVPRISEQALLKLVAEAFKSKVKIFDPDLSWQFDTRAIVVNHLSKQGHPPLFSRRSLPSSSDLPKWDELMSVDGTHIQHSDYRFHPLQLVMKYYGDGAAQNLYDEAFAHTHGDDVCAAIASQSESGSEFMLHVLNSMKGSNSRAFDRVLIDAAHVSTDQNFGVLLEFIVKHFSSTTELKDYLSNWFSIILRPFMNNHSSYPEDMEIRIIDRVNQFLERMTDLKNDSFFTTYWNEFVQSIPSAKGADAKE